MSKRDDMVVEAVSGRRPNSRGWIRANCPFCLVRLGKEDRKQCLGLQVGSSKYHCFRCGVLGHIGVLPANISCRSIHIDTSDEPVTIEPPDGYLPLWEEPALSSMACEPAYDYLRGDRKLSDQMIREARIGALPLLCRILIPIFDTTGEEWLGWISRAWVKKAERPYLYATGMDRASLLYNHAALLVETDEPAIIVEGAFDTYPFWPNGVAVLGKPSEQQVEALVSAKRPIVVVLDGDAWEEGWALMMRLRFEGQRAGCLKLPPGIDPDEVPEAIKSEARACLDSE